MEIPCIQSGMDAIGWCRTHNRWLKECDVAFRCPSCAALRAEVSRLTEYADRVHATTGIEITRLNTRIRELEEDVERKRKECCAKDSIIEGVCEERDRLKEERDHYRTLWITVSEESAELRRRAGVDK